MAENAISIGGVAIRAHELTIELRDVVRGYMVGGQSVRALDEIGRLTDWKQSEFRHHRVSFIDAVRVGEPGRPQASPTPWMG